METAEEIREKNRWRGSDSNKENSKFSTINDPEMVNSWKKRSLPQQDQQPESKIPKTTEYLMYMFAGFIDGVQALLTLFTIGPFLNPIISFFAGATLVLWFMMRGISIFGDWKKLKALLGGSIGELIPIVDILPFWTAFVWHTIKTVREKEGGKSLLGSNLINKIAKK